MVSGREGKVTSIHSPSYIEDRELVEKIKRKRRRGLVRRLVAFFILSSVTACLFVSAITSQLEEVSHKRKMKASYEQKLSDLETSGDQFTREIKRLKDPKYIGQIARRDDFMTKNGEKVFISPKD